MNEFFHLVTLKTSTEKILLPLSIVFTLCSCTGTAQEYSFDQLLEEGLSHGKAREYSKALEKLQEANALNPDNHSVHTMIGQIYLGRRNELKSLQHLKRAQQLAPRDDDILTWLGHAYIIFGKYNEAKTAYGKVLDLKPNDYEALLNMGLIAYLENDSFVCQLYLGRYKDLVEEIDPGRMTEELRYQYQRMNEYLQNCKSPQHDQPINRPKRFFDS